MTSVNLMAKFRTSTETNQFLLRVTKHLIVTMLLATPGSINLTLTISESNTSLANEILEYSYVKENIWWFHAFGSYDGVPYI